MKKLVYLTGAPASGKSTLIKGLAAEISDLKVFEYGRAMSALLKSVSRESLRDGTDGRVTQTDIDEVDRQMADWAHEFRRQNNLIIDSHHVTIESYGFRIAPFSLAKLETLQIDEFWVLIADSALSVERIERDRRGRRIPSPYQADFHTAVQASLASQYAVLTARPVYIFDSANESTDLVSAAVRRFE
ncbi:AAA family ATPase [Azorhizobium doebereinerae]|uniref:AAA family ATPase n=1 Tax=Azorhizobium doebereinerae TaxID=281091 RepID=UPI0009FF3DB9|nr:AAA family ATPase [Azorhizobium doebereinerae]